MRAVPDPRVRLEHRLHRRVKATCDTYGLLQAGDRILVAMSGGKDSTTLFHLLPQIVRAASLDITLIAVHLDQAQPGYDGAPLRAFLEASGHPFEILREDTYSVVTERLSAEQTYCSLCS